MASFSLCRKMKYLLIIGMMILGATGVKAETPNFTQGSMTSTTNTEQTVTETIAVETFGGDYASYTGTNITPSAEIGGANTTYSVHTAGEDFQLEIVERAAGIVETTDIERTIETTAVINSLSVFSQ